MTRLKVAPRIAVSLSSLLRRNATSTFKDATFLVHFDPPRSASQLERGDLLHERSPPHQEYHEVPAANNLYPSAICRSTSADSAPVANAFLPKSPDLGEGKTRTAHYFLEGQTIEKVIDDLRRRHASTPTGDGLGEG